MLVFDERDKLNGGPGFHALIAGVSAYPRLPAAASPATAPVPPNTFGMRQLSCTALSACRIYQWLTAQHTQNLLPLPLATVRLLLTPDSAEKTAEPMLNGLAEACTADNFVQDVNDWRDDAAANRDHITFFYFAGHGIQRTLEDSVLLLEGFGNRIGGALDNAVTMHDLFYGMAPTPARPNLAATQFYFVDACRNHPSKIDKFETLRSRSLWDLDLNGAGGRHAPIFYAAIADTRAYAIVGEQTIFSKALLACLAGPAGTPLGEDANGVTQWGVTVDSLSQAVNLYKAQALSPDQQSDQAMSVEGIIASDAPLCRLAKPPTTRLRLRIDPETALPLARIKVLNADHQPIWSDIPCPLSPHPYEGDVEAGVCVVETEFEAAAHYKAGERSWSVWPPKSWPPCYEWVIKCPSNP